MKRKLITLLLIFEAVLALGQEPDMGKVAGFVQDQQFEEALAYLKPFDNPATQNLRVLSYLAYTNYMLDNDKLSRNYYDRILGIDPGNISALRYLVLLTANKDPDSSILLAKRLITLKPEVASFYRSAGEGFRRLNSQDSALIYFNAAYSLLPTDPKNGAALAEVLINLKLYTRADSIIREGLKLDSMNASYLRLSVKSSYQAEDYESVIAPGERIMLTEEFSSAPVTQLALSYYKLKRYKDSYRVCQFLLDNGYELESVYYYQAKAASKLNDFAKSNELLGICLSKAISETAGIYYVNLGQNYESTREYKKAIAQYDSAYYLFKDPNMMYYIAAVYDANLKDSVQAKKYYNKYLTLARPKTDDDRRIVKFVRERLKVREKPVRRDLRKNDHDSTALKE